MGIVQREPAASPDFTVPAGFLYPELAYTCRIPAALHCCRRYLLTPAGMVSQTCMTFSVKTITMRTSFIRYCLGIMLVLALIPLVYGAAMGELRVNSRLGQPLDAEIALLAVGSDQEAASLAAAIASPDMFEQVRLPFSPVLSTVRAHVEKRPSGYVIRLTSAEPVHELNVDVLVELTGLNSRLTRKYAILPDPPGSVLAGGAPQVVQAAVPDVKVAIQAVSATPDGNGGQQVAAPQQVYVVRPGDAIMRVAQRLRYPTVSLHQMMWALYSANPSAFSANDIHRLKMGRVLIVPDEHQVGSIDDRRARAGLNLPE